MEAGICDDDDPCTEEACNPETGECTWSTVECKGCTEGFCYGPDEDAAHSLCWDNNLCTLDLCDFGDDFLPFEGDEVPEFDKCCTSDNPAWPDCDGPPKGLFLCQHIDKVEAGYCDDMDPCTIDTCDPEMGCLHQPDFDSFCCLEDYECWKGNPCQYDWCDFETGECMHEPKDCDDENPCTADDCDWDEGCTNVPDDNLPCDDGNPETTNTCINGVCVTL